MSQPQPLSFPLRKVPFRGRTVPILMQNENGPCPLLAIANILLLQNQITIHDDYSAQNIERLQEMVANRVLESNPPVADAFVEANRTKQIKDVMEVLPRLQYGLDVNIRFNAVDSFEFTAGLTAFDSLGIQLVHGWLVDPEERAVVRILDSLSYNQAVEKVVAAETITHPTVGGGAVPSKAAVMETEGQAGQPDGDDMVMVEQHTVVMEEEAKGDAHAKAYSKMKGGGNEGGFPGKTERSPSTVGLEGRIIENFLSRTASQLTFHGLTKLYEQVKDNQLCVFFRNNHFSTLFKHEGTCYLLVTDQGYLHEDRVVWEKLDSICGDSEFVDGNFTPTGPITTPTIPPLPDSNFTREELDLQRAIALSTQEVAAVVETQPQYDLGGGGAAAVGDGGGGSSGGAGGGTTSSSAISALEDADYLLALKLQQEDEQAASLAAVAAATSSTPAQLPQSQPTARRASPPLPANPASSLTDEEEYLRHFYGTGGAPPVTTNTPTTATDGMLGGEYFSPEEVERQRKAELKFRREKEKRDARRRREQRKSAATAAAAREHASCVLQ